MAVLTNEVLAHQLDPVWIIALWKAIHGGDPAPNEHVTLTSKEYATIGAEIIGSIAHSLAGAVPSVSETEMLRSNPVLRSLGIEFPEPNYPGPEYLPRCVKIPGFAPICLPIVRLA